MSRIFRDDCVIGQIETACDMRSFDSDVRILRFMYGGRKYVACRYHRGILANKHRRNKFFRSIEVMLSRSVKDDVRLPRKMIGAFL